jgi:hypothetical protein
MPPLVSIKLKKNELIIIHTNFVEHTQNAEFYGLLIGPKAEKKDTIKFGRPICNPKMLKVWPQVFFWLY